MEKLSRVKKYEKLRAEIENDSAPVGNAEDALKEYKNRVDKTDNTYSPVHEKTFLSTNEKDKDSHDTFRNEYLDSFIQEVRDYNIRKGTREHEDTKLDILQQLNSKNKEKRSQYIEKMDIEKEDLHSTDELESNSETMEISKQVLDLIAEGEDDETETGSFSSDLSGPEELVTQEEQTSKEHPITLEERIASLENQIVEENLVKEEKDDSVDLSILTKKELLEETKQLKVQMNEYKEELTELNSDVDSNNKMLNIIIVILVLALLAVIGVVVYWLISGGII